MPSIMGIGHQNNWIDQAIYPTWGLGDYVFEASRNNSLIFST